MDGLIAVQVELTSGHWYTLKHFPEKDFGRAHKMIQDISSFGICARIDGHQHSPCFGNSQIKIEDIPILEGLLEKRAQGQKDKQ